MKNISDIESNFQIMLEEISEDIKLSDIEDNNDICVEDKLKIIEAGQRKSLLDSVLPIFQWGNIIMWCSIFVLFAFDTVKYKEFGVGAGDVAVVTKEVVLALIGATVVQVGAITAGIAASLFSNKS